MKIRLFASLKEDFGSGIIEINDPKIIDIRDLREYLETNFNLKTKNCMTAVNLEYAEDNFKINDDDEISFIPPVSGGSSNDLVEIINNEIVPSEYSISKLSSYGAELTFLGISRDHNEGKKVEKLFYECYEQMAKKEILNLINKSKTEYDVGYIRVVHRIGEVSPSNISLLVIISSAHRRESLDCMSYFLDKFKKIIPIWKKEIYSDGSRWLES
ncbi:MAG: hypothetical protein CL762_03575 [Chloroflexi bacterium]|nr:hypothetical protein [Chloroflexota bacterium]|tara:strand:- start:724 stop:1365 length:642 start_codon:yes stop_codon:yes gene_type:complete